MAAWHDMQLSLNNNSPKPRFTGLIAPNSDGHYPAMEYLRVSIARDFVRERVEAGLTQWDLAKRAGVRVDTLCRIETGKHTPSVPTIERLDRALRLAAGKRKAK